jgi:hypothetical protein
MTMCSWSCASLTTAGEFPSGQLLPVEGGEATAHDATASALNTSNRDCSCASWEGTRRGKPWNSYDCYSTEDFEKRVYKPYKNLNSLQLSAQEATGRAMDTSNCCGMFRVLFFLGF